MDTLIGTIITNAPQLVGFIMPPLVEVLNRDVKTENQRFLVALIACFMAAVILHWKEVAYGTPEQVMVFAGIIFTESQVLYKLYFNGSMWQYRVQSLIKSNRLEEWVDEEAQAPLEKVTP